MSEDYRNQKKEARRETKHKKVAIKASKHF